MGDAVNDPAAQEENFNVGDESSVNGEENYIQEEMNQRNVDEISTKGSGKSEKGDGNSEQEDGNSEKCDVIAPEEPSPNKWKIIDNIANIFVAAILLISNLLVFGFYRAWSACITVCNYFGLTNQSSASLDLKATSSLAAANDQFKILRACIFPTENPGELKQENGDAHYVEMRARMLFSGPKMASAEFHLFAGQMKAGVPDEEVAVDPDPENAIVAPLPVPALMAGAEANAGEEDMMGVAGEPIPPPFPPPDAALIPAMA